MIQRRLILTSAGASDCITPASVPTTRHMIKITGVDGLLFMATQDVCLGLIVIGRGLPGALRAGETIAAGPCPPRHRLIIIVSGTLERTPRGAWLCSDSLSSRTGPPAAGAPSAVLPGVRAALAALVLLLVAGRGATRSCPWSRWNDRLDASVPAPLPGPIGVVGAISGHRLGSLARPAAGPRYRDRVHQVGEHDRLVALPCRQDRGQRQALPVAREVDLRRESAS
jgi:hypothetical protein